MIWVAFWLAVGGGIFLWNHFKTPFLGIRFTDQLFGFPIDGGWLCLAIALYCLIRFFVRRSRAKKDTAGAGKPQT